MLQCRLGVVCISGCFFLPRATKCDFFIIGSVMCFVGLFVVYVELGMLATNCLCFRALQSTIYHVFHLCTPPRFAAAVARSNRIGGSRRYCWARASPLDVVEIGSCVVRVRRPCCLSLSADRKNVVPAQCHDYRRMIVWWTMRPMRPRSITRTPYMYFGNLQIAAGRHSYVAGFVTMLRGR